MGTPAENSSKILAGRRALVTGAATGIGLQLPKHWRASGQVS